MAPTLRLVSSGSVSTMLFVWFFATASHASVCTSPFLFATRTDIHTGANPHCVAIGDFNHDGIPDLAVATSFYIATGGVGGNVSVLIGHGDGTFAPQVNYLAGTEPWSIVTGDFNHDGITDLAVANIGSNNISILLGLGSGGVGNGTFAAPVNYAAGPGPFGLVSGDFNHDGITDLAVSNNSASSVSVLLGLGSGGVGNGTFSPPTSYALSGIGANMAVGDFNSDGITDLVVTEYYQSTVAVLLGQGSGGIGDGTFSPAVHYTTGEAPFSVAVVDLNGDGISDLAFVGNSSGPTGGTGILFGSGSGGHGNGTFGAPIYFNSGNAAWITPIDLNGDGLLDLAVAHTDPYSPGSLETFFGGGSGGVNNGGFTAGTAYDLGNDPLHLAFGDFNGDGRLDVAVSNYYDDRISILLGTCAPDPRLPVMTHVKDVPNDQGGKVFLTWLASSLDVTGGPVNAYRVWREIPPLAAGNRAMPVSSSPNAPIRATRVTRPNGVTDFVYWEALATLPAQRLPGYGYTAATTQDSMPGSNPYSVFFITALTSDIDVFYDSDPDSGYSVDNLAPAAPRPFAAQFSGTGVALHWGANTEGDLAGYRLYRGTDPSFVPSPGALVSAQPDTGFFDPSGSGLSVYKLAAVDIHGNLGPFATAQLSIPTAVEISLNSTEVAEDHVRLVWHVAGSSQVTVFRSDDGVLWNSLAQIYPTGDGAVTYVDATVRPGATYHYRLGVIDGSGEVVGGETVVMVPAPRLALDGVQPNPLATGARFVVSFALPSSDPAGLDVFDASGRRVAGMDVGALGPGSHRVSLDDGARLRAGLYMIRLRQGGRVLTARAVVLR